MIARVREWYALHLKQNPTNICRLVTISALSISFLVFALALFIRLFVSYSHPRIANEINQMDDTRLQSQFPKLAICPARSDVVISSILCDFHDVKVNPDNKPDKPSYTKTKTPVGDAVPVAHNIETERYNCFDVNLDQSKSPIISTSESHSFMGCQVYANGDLKVQPYSYSLRSPWDHWQGWTHVRYKEVTSISVHSDQFYGHVYYETTREDEETRLGPSAEDVKFSINFAGTWKSNYAVAYQYDFWSTLGILGGILLLHIIAYKAIMAAFALTKYGKQDKDLEYVPEPQESKVASTLPIVGYGAA